MKQFVFGALLAGFVLGLSLAGYAASTDETSPTPVFPQVYSGDSRFTDTSKITGKSTENNGLTLQEFCISRMADMGMDDETIRYCAGMMDKMTDGQGGMMGQMKGMMNGMKKGMCMGNG